MVPSARSRSVLTLYTTADDVQCHRARLVLAAKGVSYERVLVDPARPPEDLVDLNPYASTPTLVDRDLTLFDTSVVCEYLDERYPHPPLMPIDPQSRARLRVAAVRIEKDWLTEVDIIRAGGRPADAARKRLRGHLLSSVPLFKAAKFFLNPEMSLADCLVAPVIWRLPWLGVELGREGKPVIDYGERLFHSQGFARSMTDQEKAMRQIHEQE
ncbi:MULTISPECIES: glutathione S-transferase N-terminal domain-containing protein [Rhodanobacter]|uniref:Glutathione S-transferase n=1 Tax=Rhodanobacter denitrificans TaxID=666685 RepID=I4WYG3_9GAMM|nr:MULTISPECIES: glutathione S-transferase N-terminal domain-containing protein [Rhodanobacter]AGG90015.1 glutathione S-transferase [Rhodanobacter denitrificans]EIM04505.1 stringent starvation protein A [Rhodanobacter denitrificans]KZC20334.1 stringent starvation protein A [Rhodanobacter denitrificans]UJJ50128.1 glutathione S-transferase N-terminal domain-containing protein [Rhodanobacter denitrificans]UJJ57680.1 glutathione S-transferase N-terminal domain-containing protein [Rhodanobacter den